MKNRKEMKKIYCLCLACLLVSVVRCKMNVNQEWRECVKLSDDMGKHMGSNAEVEACLYELRLK